MKPATLVFAAMFATAGPAAFASVLGETPTLAGLARAIDGDTIVLGDERVRLLGIDAPEMSQTCQRDGQSWRCASMPAMHCKV